MFHAMNTAIVLFAGQQSSVCVSMTGIGKSALLSEFSTPAADKDKSTNHSRAGRRFTNTSVSVLSGDVMRSKQGITGMRYWHQVGVYVVFC